MECDQLGGRSTPHSTVFRQAGLSRRRHMEGGGSERRPNRLVQPSGMNQSLLTWYCPRRRLTLFFRGRLILEVVIMVLRGVQFQRSGPAGCAFLTRRALFWHRVTVAAGQFHAICLQLRKPDDARTAIRFRGRDQCRQSYEGLASHARAGDLCHGPIGESSSVSQPWW